MKFFAKPSLILIFSFVLGYIGALFLPVTTIQYEVIDKSQPDINGTIMGTGIGYASASDRYGMEALPCNLPRFAWSNSSYKIFYKAWQTVTYCLFFLVISFGLSYVRRRKMPLLQFFVLVLILMLAPAGIALMFPDTRIDCNENTFYQITSFTPYLPTIFLLLLGFFIQYRTIRLMNTLNNMETNKGSANALQS